LSLRWQQLQTLIEPVGLHLLVVMDLGNQIMSKG